jgi:hypothetical protein
MFLLRLAAQGQGGPPERRVIRTEEELKQYFAAHGYTDYKKVFEEAWHKDTVVGLLTVHLDADMFARMKVNLPRGGVSYIAYGTLSKRTSLVPSPRTARKRSLGRFVFWDLDRNAGPSEHRPVH